ncbi:hypothetical protein [Anaeromicropila populeti]|uniref:Uncharacterized protein n=1 Tax=Anaeromicropila populeti TaxID=37658 RepID=A0A1I6JAA8_9FIRM|nr:hypothetical protein [Anaeromicropila populeti]SFR75945.1 hypothetical protein SAMN05661086_01506 [Anaeromicropila populeti]
MKEIKVVILKVIIFAAVCIVVSAVFQSYETTYYNELALKQLNGGADEYAKLKAYGYIKNYLGYGYVLLFLLLFFKNIVDLAKRCIEALKGKGDKA